MTMLPSLVPGLTGTLQQRVSADATARRLGSGSIDVLATPELVRLMEAAAVKALADQLPAEFTTVGASISVDHVAPTPIGLNVTVEAILVEVRGRRLKFQILARDSVEEIGRAVHERVLVEVENFVGRANRKLG